LDKKQLLAASLDWQHLQFFLMACGNVKLDVEARVI